MAVSLFKKNKIVMIKPSLILPNPSQPRQYFDEKSIRELADSISQYGIIQPLSIRQNGSCYELIAGERRLRAARLLGLSEVPCIILGAGSETSSMIALIENIQRQDLDFFEEAEGIYNLIKTFNLSQEEAALKIGKSQSSVANKLRLLKLSPECISIIKENSLSERHARALLKLDDNQDRLAVLNKIISQHLNVAQTDELVKKFLNNSNEKSRKTRYLIKDVRIFVNSINKAVGIMKKSGVDANLERFDTDSKITFTITVPRFY